MRQLRKTHLLGKPLIWVTFVLTLMVVLCTVVSTQFSGPGGDSSTIGAIQADGADLDEVDHFKCYSLSASVPSVSPESLTLRDQFDKALDQVEDVEELRPGVFCNPVEKNHNGEQIEIENEDAHLTCYSYRGLPINGSVEISNQFHTVELNLKRGLDRLLCVPTEKLSFDLVTDGARPAEKSAANRTLTVGADGLDLDLDLDHFKCYFVNENIIDESVTLQDQFDEALDRVERVEQLESTLFCNPVEKNHNGEQIEIENEDAHLTCYRYTPAAISVSVEISNQFHTEELPLGPKRFLCVPTEKLSFEVEGGTTPGRTAALRARAR